jgi:tRNA/rRNA methyltransferase
MKTAYDIFFILVKPAVPGNVGAAARAMKTMGFSKMRLVNPCDHLSMEARMLAHGSNEVLENAELFGSLADAVSDIDFVIGTTARKRTARVDYHFADTLPGLIEAKGKSVRKIAIVFGSEESGLSNEDAALCHLLSTVSMVATYPSLNLSQAVMVYAYELSVLAGRKQRKTAIKRDEQGWAALKDKSQQLLQAIGISNDTLLYTRIMERFALLGDTDVHLLHSIAARVAKKLKKKV